MFAFISFYPVLSCPFQLPPSPQQSSPSKEPNGGGALASYPLRKMDGQGRGAEDAAEDEDEGEERALLATIMAMQEEMEASPR